jgi:hypothetical protein
MVGTTPTTAAANANSLQCVSRILQHSLKHSEYTSVIQEIVVVVFHLGRVATPVRVRVKG